MLNTWNPAGGSVGPPPTDWEADLIVYFQLSEPQKAITCNKARREIWVDSGLPSVCVCVCGACVCVFAGGWLEHLRCHRTGNESLNRTDVKE